MRFGRAPFRDASLRLLNAAEILGIRGGPTHALSEGARVFNQAVGGEVDHIVAGSQPLMCRSGCPITPGRKRRSCLPEVSSAGGGRNDLQEHSAGGRCREDRHSRFACSPLPAVCVHSLERRRTVSVGTSRQSHRLSVRNKALCARITSCSIFPRRRSARGRSMNLEDLYRLLRNGHIEAQGIIDTVLDPLLVLDRNLCVRSASRAFFATFNVDRDETIGQHLYELGNGQWDIPELRRLLEEVIPRSTAVVDYEVEHDLPSIGRRTMLVSAHRLFHPDNNSRTLLLSIVDATERRQLEAEKDVLLGELRHRMKNLLGLVQAIARQTKASDRTGEEYRDAFLGRFNALLQAHNAAYSQEGEADLHEVLQRTLEPYSEGSLGVLVEPGQSVSLASKQIMPLSLIVHELATNAIYGALSTPSGQVRVRWEVEEASAPSVRLVWEESGGPSVTPPSSFGFGTQLIEFAVSRELAGRVELNDAPCGLVVEIVAPLGSVS